MKQNTNHSFPLIVGNGRLARHWKHYLKLENLPYFEWSRQNSMPFAQYVASVASKISCVYVLISDAAIESFYREYASVLPASASWFHASGALSIEGMLDAHPMMTFADALYDVERYRSMAITTASDITKLENSLLADLQNSVTEIRADDKARYHALCVLGGAGTGSIWTLLEKEWQLLGIEPAAWKVYQSQIFSNLSEQGRGAITGPWVRGDKLTTAKNLESLRTDSAKKLYEILKGVFDEYREH